eukprot:scaffold845_cov364-Prasinococcus_capsulatus_cf.AAC.28
MQVRDPSPKYAIAVNRGASERLRQLQPGRWWAPARKCDRVASVSCSGLAAWRPQRLAGRASPRVLLPAKQI